MSYPEIITKTSSKTYYVVFYKITKEHWFSASEEVEYYESIYDEVCPNNEDWGKTHLIEKAFELPICGRENSSELAQDAVCRIIQSIKEFSNSYYPEDKDLQIGVQMFCKEIKHKETRQRFL